MMTHTTLGRTGLTVSTMGLGAGGHSRLGQSYGAGEDNAAAIVRRALDLGVNFVDTAESYGTEPAVGKGIAGRRRDDVILSTKKSIEHDGNLIGPDDLLRGLDDSLRRLGTDHVEIYHLHGVPLSHYAHCREHLVPALLRARDQGKIRFLGITEGFGSDTGHRMLATALHDDCWDVVMVGFNLLNQSARQRVVPLTAAKNVGVLNMFAVRSALSRPEKLRQTIRQLIDQDLIDPDEINPQDPLGFLTRDGIAPTIPDAAYRFCRDEPGLHVILSGTGNLDHLDQNAESLLRPPLPPAVREQLVRLFAKVDNVSGQ